MPATDCEINQATWNAAVPVAGGGEVWADDGLRWSWQAHSGQLMLNFPRAIDLATPRRGVEALETGGFERGWEPWRMAAPLESITETHTIRLALLYALADGKQRIGPQHLDAALSLDDHAARSATTSPGTAATASARDAPHTGRFDYSHGSLLLRRMVTHHPVFVSFSG